MCFSGKSADSGITNKAEVSPKIVNINQNHTGQMHLKAWFFIKKYRLLESGEHYNACQLLYIINYQQVVCFKRLIIRGVIYFWVKFPFVCCPKVDESQTSTCSSKEKLVFSEPKQFCPSLQLYWASFTRSLPDMAEALAHGAKVNFINTEEEKRSPLIMAVHGVSYLMTY